MLDQDLENLLNKFPNGKQHIITLPQGRIYLNDAKDNPDKFIDRNDGTLCLTNSSCNPIELIVLDRFVATTHSSIEACDFCISKKDSSDFIVLCELKDIREIYLQKSLSKATSQLIATYSFLKVDHQIQCRFIYASLGIKLKNSNPAIKRQFLKFNINTYHKNKAVLKASGFDAVFDSFVITDEEPFVVKPAKRK